MKNTFTPLLLLAASLAGPAGLRAQQLYTNGTFSTGSRAKDGTNAPTGTTWSEVQNDTGVTTISNASSGFSGSKAAGYSLADDFTVPSGQTYTINSVSVFGYQTGYAGTTSPFTELYVRIWSGSPAATGSTVVFGDLTTNRLASSVSTATYRIFNSLYPSASTPGTTRLIWKVRATISPALSLPAGTYWLEWTSNVTANAAHFYVPVTTVGMRQTMGANALQSTGTGYTAVIDDGTPTSAPDVTIDFPFLLNDATVTATASARPAGPALRVGPVPTADNVEVEFTEPRGASTLVLSDMQGRQVWAGQAAARSAQATVPMSTLAAGLYTLSVTSAEGVSQLRVAKQ